MMIGVAVFRIVLILSWISLAPLGVEAFTYDFFYYTSTDGSCSGALVDGAHTDPDGGVCEFVDGLPNITVPASSNPDFIGQSFIFNCSALTMTVYSNSICGGSSLVVPVSSATSLVCFKLTNNYDTSSYCPLSG